MKNGSKPVPVVDLSAYREWQSWPEERRQLYLNNAFCHNCRQSGHAVSSFAPGYTIRKDYYGLIIEGKCAVCGHDMARYCD